MSTKINLPPYCDGCPEIKPKAEVTQTVNMLDDDVNITCTKLKTCEKIKNYLAEQYRSGKIDIGTGETR